MRNDKNGRTGSALKKILAGAAITAGAAAAAEAVTVTYFFNSTMKRQHARTERSMKMSGTDWSKYYPFIQESGELMEDWPREEASIESFDGLKLSGTYFLPPKDAEKKKVVICFHGYTGEGVSNFKGYAHYYLKKGFGMLIPDARAHGKSEGTYIGFGCLDRRDALGWIKWLIEKEGEDIEIILHGVSMGGSTVLMASSMDLPKQVKGVVSDCAFTSADDVFSHVLKTMYHVPPKLVIPAANQVNKRLAGYGMDECNALREVEHAKVPILFIHGTKDNFVPFEMCDKLYRNCCSEKRKLIVEGAAHAESYYMATEEYEGALDDFMELALK